MYNILHYTRLSKKNNRKGIKKPAVRESSFNMTRGGGNSKREILAAPSLVVEWPPLSCWFWSIQIFGAPPNFFIAPFRVSKNFRSPPQYLHPPCHVKWTFPCGCPIPSLWWTYCGRKIVGLHLLVTRPVPKTKSETKHFIVSKLVLSKSFNLKQHFDHNLQSLRAPKLLVRAQKLQNLNCMSLWQMIPP